MEKKEYSFEDLKKAQSEIEAILAKSSDASINSDVFAKNPQDQMFDDPNRALMEEEAIQKASEPMVALAAFIGEFASGLQKAVSIINDKVDALATVSMRSNSSMMKAMLDSSEMIKSFQASPAEMFKSEHIEQIQTKSATKPSYEFAKAHLLELSKSGSCTVQDMSRFEASRQIPSRLLPAVMNAWNNANGR